MIRAGAIWRRRAVIAGVLLSIGIVGWWIYPRPLRGNVPIFYAGWDGALVVDGIEIRLESARSDVLLFKPTGLFEVSQPAPTFDIVRFDAKTNTMSRVGLDAWEQATGPTRNEGNTRRLPNGTRTADEEIEVQRRGAEPYAAKIGVEFAICPECPDIAASLNAEGPYRRGGGWKPDSVGGQHYVELRNWRQERRIGQAIPVQFDEHAWRANWSGDCRFLVFTSGIGASLKIAVIPVSALAGEIPCSQAPSEVTGPS